MVLSDIGFIGQRLYLFPDYFKTFLRKGSLGTATKPLEPYITKIFKWTVIIFDGILKIVLLACRYYQEELPYFFYRGNLCHSFRSHDLKFFYERMLYVKQDLKAI